MVLGRERNEVGVFGEVEEGPCSCCGAIDRSLHEPTDKAHCAHRNFINWNLYVLSYVGGSIPPLMSAS